MNLLINTPVCIYRVSLVALPSPNHRIHCFIHKVIRYEKIRPFAFPQWPPFTIKEFLELLRILDTRHPNAETASNTLSALCPGTFLPPRTNTLKKLIHIQGWIFNLWGLKWAITRDVVVSEVAKKIVEGMNFMGPFASSGLRKQV